MKTEIKRNSNVNITRLYKRRRDYIKINPSGWINSKFPVCTNEREYKLPYSSHSNFRELEKFVASIRPSVIKCVVTHGSGHIEKINGVYNLGHYSWCLQKIKQRGPELFTQQYTNFHSRSDNYKKSMEHQEKMKIAKILGLQFTESEVLEEDTRGYDASTYQILYKEDEEFEKGYIPEFQKEEPKERGKSMKIDRMIKKHNKISEKENIKIVGTKKRPIDQDKLLKNLHQENAIDVIENVSTQVRSIGDAIKVMIDFNREKELSAAGIVTNTDTNKNMKKTKDKREEDGNNLLKNHAKR